MLVIKILLGTIGVLICVWTITLHRLSVAQRPGFSKVMWFRVGIPLLGGLMTLTGFGLALWQSILWGGLAVLATLALTWLVLAHDQHSAMIRILYDDYFKLKRENPQASEFDLLYSIVKSRRPRWTEDRILEVCAGKDIKQLVLLLLVLEFEIHPLNDMQLYERFKQQAERLYPRP